MMGERASGAFKTYMHVHIYVFVCICSCVHVSLLLAFGTSLPDLLLLLLAERSELSTIGQVREFLLFSCLLASLSRQRISWS